MLLPFVIWDDNDNLCNVCSDGVHCVYSPTTPAVMVAVTDLQAGTVKLVDDAGGGYVITVIAI